MSEHDSERADERSPVQDGELLDVEVVEAELVDGDSLDALPVVASPAELTRPRWTANPGVQAAAAAATGFVAGAATLALLRRKGVRQLASKVGALGDPLDQARPPAPRPFPLRPGQTYIVQVRVLSPRPPE